MGRFSFWGSGFFFASAGLGVWGDDVTGLFRTPPDPKRRTPPYSPLRGLTFVKQAPFLTGSSRALHLRPSTNAPESIVPAPANGNFLKQGIYYNIICIKMFWLIYKIGIFAVTKKTKSMYNMSVITFIVDVVVAWPAR